MNKKIAVSAIVLGLGAYLLYKYKGGSMAYQFPNGFNDLDNWNRADDGSDSADNKLTKFMVAIAEAEGYGVPGAIPTRANNPGDLTKSFGMSITGENLGSAGIVVFSTRDDGWKALEKQLLLIQGGSSIHKLTDSILQLALGWTTTQQDEWANNVSASLGTDPSAKVGDFLS
jgi:hypothetical protein